MVTAIALMVDVVQLLLLVVVGWSFVIVAPLAVVVVSVVALAVVIDDISGRLLTREDDRVPSGSRQKLK